MSPPRKVTLSPVQEGLVGGVVGAVLGGILMLARIVSPLGALGVVAGVALGSWFNAWRRSKKDRGQ